MTEATEMLKSYDPKTIDIPKLAKLLLRLNPKQREALELLLDKEAIAVLKESDEDIKEGRTIPMG